MATTFPSSPFPPLLRHPEDGRTLAFGVLFALSLAAQWHLRSDGEPFWVKAVLFLLTAFQALQGGVAVHNAAHAPPLRSSRANRLLFLALTLWQGGPVASYVPGHNESHHRHLQTERDVMRTTKVQWNSQLLNLLTFFVTVLPSVLRNDLRYMRARRGSPLHAQFLAQTALLHFFLLALLLLDWRKTVEIYLAPTVTGKGVLVTLNLLQHDGCDPTSVYDHSRNFTGPLLNYLLFNNGFHTAHHLYPSLHWSALPAAHDKISSHIHPSLLQPSILSYTARTYLAGRPRCTYDGRAKKVPP